MGRYASETADYDIMYVNCNMIYEEQYHAHEYEHNKTVGGLSSPIFQIHITTISDFELGSKYEIRRILLKLERILF